MWRKEDIQLRLISSESPDDGSGSLSVVQLYSEVGLADTATQVSQPANSFPSLQLSSKNSYVLILAIVWYNLDRTMQEYGD